MMGIAVQVSDKREEGPVIAEAPTWRPRIERGREVAPQPQVPPEEVVQDLDPPIRATLDVAKRAFPELWAALTPAGRRSFVTELVEAAMSDHSTDGDRVASVVRAWYQTMILMSDPDYEKNAELARQETRHPKGETVEELRRQLT
jgi:hypothetical protein